PLAAASPAAGEGPARSAGGEGISQSWMKRRPSPGSLRSPPSPASGRGEGTTRLPMPGAGTDRTKIWSGIAGRIVVLVEPQLGENIGTTARAMANFGLARLRLVKPRDRWPNPKAHVAASGADRILDEAQLFDTLPEAIADCTFVFAAT